MQGKVKGIKAKSKAKALSTDYTVFHRLKANMVKTQVKSKSTNHTRLRPDETSAVALLWRDKSAWQIN